MPAPEAVGMWKSRRDFQGVWEAWKAGFLAFHAFHTLSFPRPALEARFTTSQSPRRPVLRTGSTHHKRAPLPGLGFECTAQPLQKGTPFMTSTKKYTVIKVRRFRVTDVS